MNRACFLLLAVAAFLPQATPAAEEASWPSRVLITNDNGIEDSRLVALARAMAAIAETHVVAATTDRSGTSNYFSAIRTGTFEVERRDLGEGIEAWALDGYPADCVIFALSGPLWESPPDLVISGINGGPNLGDDWFGSGTIGAARTAAYFGVPAIAVSGLDDDDPQAVRAAVKWVVELVQSDAVRDLRPPQYLTVSLPVAPPSSVVGVDIVPRARGLITGKSEPTAGGAAEGRQIWRLSVQRSEDAPEGTDVGSARAGKIAVVPMRVDEFDPELAERLRSRPDILPRWSPPKPSPGQPRRCRSGFGAIIDDAEDDAGNEWGVLIEEVMPGGSAEALGIVAGDVIVAMNGVELATTDRRSREDPDDRLAKMLNDIDCGAVVVLDYVRNGERLQVRFRVPDGPQP